MSFPRQVSFANLVHTIESDGLYREVVRLGRSAEAVRAKTKLVRKYADDFGELAPVEVARSVDLNDPTTAVQTSRQFLAAQALPLLRQMVRRLERDPTFLKLAAAEADFVRPLQRQ